MEFKLRFIVLASLALPITLKILLDNFLSAQLYASSFYCGFFNLNVLPHMRMPLKHFDHYILYTNQSDIPLTLQSRKVSKKAGIRVPVSYLDSRAN